MQLPLSYGDLIPQITESLYVYSSDDLINLFSTHTPLGSIIPSKVCKSLELKEIIEILQTSDEIMEDLLDEIHNTLSSYFEEKIRIFNSVAQSYIDGSLPSSNDFNKEYLWAERMYFSVFGLWSPRMIAIYLNDDKGSKIIASEYNYEKYGYCYMENNEINLNKCLSCPFLHLLNDDVYCKYRNKVRSL